MSVIQKIHEVMKKVDHVDPSKMEFGKTKYNYISEAELTSTLRTAMIEVGLVVYPTNLRSRTMLDGGKTLSDAEVTYVIADVEANDWVEGISYITTSGAGQGADSADKALSKAMTAAYKVMQRQVFMIPSPGRDDPDTTPSEAYSAPQRHTAAPAAHGKGVFSGGKYAGKTYEEAITIDRSYCEWAANKFKDEALIEMLAKTNN